MAEGELGRNKAQDFVAEVLRTLADRELAPGDVANLLLRAQALDPREIREAVETLAAAPTPARRTRAATTGRVLEEAAEKPGHLKMRATKRQRIILDRLAFIYGSGALAAYVLKAMAHEMRYAAPTNHDLKVAGHFAGAHHTAALIATALWAEPHDLWPAVLASANAAQGIYVRDHHDLIRARTKVIEPLRRDGRGPRI